MDTLEGGHLVAFAEIDIYTKEVEVVLRPTLTSDNGSAGLRTARFRRFTGRVEVRQPDDVPVFKGACAHQARPIAIGIILLARTKRPNRPIFIECFNRTLHEERLGWRRYRADDLSRVIPDVETLLARYRYHRPH
jgi:hypothetical protein